METIDTGTALFNAGIWSEPIKKPVYGCLGANQQPIEVWQIPFNYKALISGDSIKNDYDERLYYNGEFYTLFTDNPQIFLGTWFCKWEKC